MAKFGFEPDEDYRAIVARMCEGNPGALNAMMAMMTEDYVRGYAALHTLNDLEITGSRIYVCFNYLCRCDVKTFIDKVLDHSIKEDLTQWQKAEEEKRRAWSKEENSDSTTIFRL